MTAESVHMYMELTERQGGEEETSAGLTTLTAEAAPPTMPEHIWHITKDLNHFYGALCGSCNVQTPPGSS